MGNYRFKFSELIPNAWFYKLKDMRKSSRKPQKQNTTLSASSNKKHHAVPTSSTTTTRSPRLQSRRSSYYSRPDKTTPSNSPTDETTVKFPGNKPRHRTTVTTKAPADPKLMTSSAVSSTCSCRTKTWSQRKSDFNTQFDFSTTSGDSTATGTGSFSPEFRSDQILLPDESSLDINSSPCSCITSIKPKSLTFTPPKLDLRPIITKSTPARRSSVNSPAGVRLRLRSPRISGRRSTSRSASSSSTLNSRRSRAVVKASLDPKRDFKESMMEMIVENKIRASKDLEELLACYLCLNSDEYHDIIINVFKQIWLDLKFPLSISK